MKKPKKVYAYLCGVDWQYEIQPYLGMPKMFLSIEDLKKYSSCWKECGIVKIELTLVEWVAKQDFSQGKNK